MIQPVPDAYSRAVCDLVDAILRPIPCPACRARWLVNAMPQTASWFGIEEFMAGYHGANCDLRKPAGAPRFPRTRVQRQEAGYSREVTP